MEHQDRSIPALNSASSSFDRHVTYIHKLISSKKLIESNSVQEQSNSGQSMEMNQSDTNDSINYENAEMIAKKIAKDRDMKINAGKSNSKDTSREERTEERVSYGKNQKHRVLFLKEDDDVNSHCFSRDYESEVPRTYVSWGNVENVDISRTLSDEMTPEDVLEKLLQEYSVAEPSVAEPSVAEILVEDTSVAEDSVAVDSFDESRVRMDFRQNARRKNDCSFNRKKGAVTRTRSSVPVSHSNSSLASQTLAKDLKEQMKSALDLMGESASSNGDMVFRKKTSRSREGKEKVMSALDAISELASVDEDITHRRDTFRLKEADDDTTQSTLFGSVADNSLESHSGNFVAMLRAKDRGSLSRQMNCAGRDILNRNATNDDSKTFVSEIDVDSIYDGLSLTKEEIQYIERSKQRTSEQKQIKKRKVKGKGKGKGKVKDSFFFRLCGEWKGFDLNFCSGSGDTICVRAKCKSDLPEKKESLNSNSASPQANNHKTDDYNFAGLSIRDGNKGKDLYISAFPAIEPNNLDEANNSLPSALDLPINLNESRSQVGAERIGSVSPNMSVSPLEMLRKRYIIGNAGTVSLPKKSTNPSVISQSNILDAASESFSLPSTQNFMISGAQSDGLADSVDAIFEESCHAGMPGSLPSSLVKDHDETLHNQFVSYQDLSNNEDSEDHMYAPNSINSRSQFTYTARSATGETEYISDQGALRSDNDELSSLNGGLDNLYFSPVKDFTSSSRFQGNERNLVGKKNVWQNMKQVTHGGLNLMRRKGKSKLKNILR